MAAARLVRRWPLVALLALAGLAAAILLGSRPPPGPPYAVARRLVDRHCLGCHAEHPSIPAFPLPPRDVKLDTAAEMSRHAALIYKTVVETRTMPLVNQTGMTDEERALLGGWARAAARLR